MDVWILCIILFLWSAWHTGGQTASILYIVCVKRPWAQRETQPPQSPHLTIPSARPAVFLYFVMTGLGPPRGPPPYLHPQAQGPGNISFSLSVPSRIGSNIAFWSPAIRSILSTGCEDPSLAVSLCVLSFSLVAFYSFLWLLQFSVFVLLFPCFLLFSVLSELPSGTPVFPLKDSFQLSSLRCIPAHGRNFIYFIFSVQARVLACITFYFMVILKVVERAWTTCPVNKIPPAVVFTVF